MREGTSPGHVIIIEFPDRVHAAQWYESPAYQAILPLRTDNSVGTVLLIDGVDDDHRATDVLVPAEASIVQRRAVSSPCRAMKMPSSCLAHRCQAFEIASSSSRVLSPYSRA
jgi:Domain of unknown function (DUF1330)